MQYTSPLEDILRTNDRCSCGRAHSCSLQSFYVLPDSSEEFLPELLERFSARRLHFISSSSAMEALGERIHSRMSSLGYPVSSSVFPPESGFVCDHVSAGDLLIHVPYGTDVIVAVGEKTVCDLAKFVCSKQHLPLIFLPVSASSDTFSMPEAEFTENDRRIRLPVPAPTVIVADISVLSAAPTSSSGAGVASLLADIISFSDWDLCSSVTGSSRCSELSGLLSDRCRDILRRIENGISPKDSTLMSDLITCLVLAGVISDLTGTLLPVRGSESCIARTAELKLVSEDITDISFETLRGIASLYCVRMYEYLRKNRPDTETARQDFYGIDRVYFNSELFRVFGEKEGHRILSSFGGENYYQAEGRMRRLNLLSRIYDEVMPPLWSSLPSSSRMTSLLRTLSVPTSFYDIGFTREEILDILIWGKELSGSYDITKLLADFLVLEKAAYTMV